MTGGDSDYMREAIRLRYGWPKETKKEDRQANLDGRVGAYTKRFIKGLDLIAIGSGPHAGALIRTTRTAIAIDFEIEENGQIVTGKANYKRVYNEIAGAFVFVCTKIFWG